MLSIGFMKLIIIPDYCAVRRSRVYLYKHVKRIGVFHFSGKRQKIPAIRAQWPLEVIYVKIISLYPFGCNSVAPHGSVNWNDGHRIFPAQEPGRSLTGAWIETLKSPKRECSISSFPSLDRKLKLSWRRDDMTRHCRRAFSNFLTKAADYVYNNLKFNW